MTTNNNRYFAIIFYAGGLALVLAVTLFLLTGCNAEKRAVKKSDKHFFKAVAWDKANVHGRCSDIAPPIVMTKDSFIYKPGKYIPSSEPEYVYVDCDSVVNETKKNGSLLYGSKVNLKCPPCDSVRVDTAYVSVRNTEVDRNKEIALEAHIKKVEELATKRHVQLRIAIIALSVLSAYTLLRWILRIWGVKLP